MNNEWKELGYSELASRSDAVLRFCAEQDYSTGQSIRALLIAGETVFRVAMKYQLPPDEEQEVMIKEIGDRLVPLFEKHGMAMASMLIFLVGNLVQPSVDIKTSKRDGE